METDEQVVSMWWEVLTVHYYDIINHCATGIERHLVMLVVMTDRFHTGG